MHIEGPDRLQVSFLLFLGSLLHGPAFMFTFFGTKFAFINHPISISQIERQTHAMSGLQEMAKIVVILAGLPEPKQVVEMALNQLVPLMSRKLSTPSITTPESTEKYTRLLLAELDKMVPLGSPSTKLPVWDFVARTTYNASSLYLFGPTFPTDTYEDFMVTFERVTLIASPVGKLPFYSGTRARQRLLSSMCAYLKPCWDGDVDVVFPDAHELIKECMQIMKNAGCSLKEGAGIFIAFQFGIHGNTWFHLHQLLGRVLLDPEYRPLIEEEVRQAKDITEMKHLESAMWEALRRPFRLIQIRPIIEDVEIQLGKTRYFVEKGTWIIPKTLDHDPAIFSEPFEFKPGRFLDPSIPKPRIFGEGHRVVSVH